MTVVHSDLFTAVRDLRTNWGRWDTVARAEAVAALRRSRLSVATLARITNCSPASIRRMEIIGELPLHLRARIRAGESSGRFVAWARALRLAKALGIAPAR